MKRNICLFMMSRRDLLCFFIYAASSIDVVAASGAANRRSAVQSSSTAQSVALDLSPYYNNKAFGTYPGEASFDNLGQSYPAPDLPAPFYTSGSTGILYSFPGYTGPEDPDNVICSGQTIAVPSLNTTDAGNGSYPYFSASFLISGDVELATVTANATFAYDDGSTSVHELRTLDWFSFLTLNRGELIFGSRFTPDGVNYNTSHIFERTVALEPSKKLRSITLPQTTDASAGRMHIFAVSLWKPAAGTGSAGVDVQSVRPTQKWLEDGAQVIEVTVNNVGSDCVTGDGLTLSLSGDGFNTTTKGSLKRLCPGDQKIVSLGVEGSSDGPANVSITIDDSASRWTVQFGDVEIGLTQWTEDLDNLARHESPDWFNDAKYGIFIHWGPYSVTGWGNSSPHESYAEWFWWYSTHHPQADPSDFYDYRLRTYGPDWAYDDTFPHFTASAFDPKEWVDLFADAGAKYFVITSKHHDGFALFDAGATSNRTSLHYGPQRDLLRELFDAAAEHQPSLRRGTYFSLPEWYNPSFGPYGFDQFPASSVPATNSWPGVLATNPYTGAAEPYTGHVDVGDFLSDVMLPQMEALAHGYGVDIMWCDIGGPNATAPFAASWWNAARAEGRQVAANSRCGLAQAADFDTPEYASYASAQARKWESNRGMDPYSYGYNAATPDADYMNASTVVRTLVDIVAKNGNLLLDIGPRADGSLVQAEVDSLREAGGWIRAHGEAIFGTRYWFVQSQGAVDGGPDLRFTHADEAFYVLFLEKPVVADGRVSVPAPVPILEGDGVSLLAVEGGEALRWSVSGQGRETVLSIEVGEDLLEKEEFCWVFKIKYA